MSERWSPLFGQDKLGMEIDIRPVANCFTFPQKKNKVEWFHLRIIYMPTIIPHSALVRQAVEFIALELKAMQEKSNEELPPGKIYELVEKACFKFDLSPQEADMLHDFLERDKL